MTLSRSAASTATSRSTAPHSTPRAAVLHQRAEPFRLRCPARHTAPGQRLQPHDDVFHHSVLPSHELHRPLSLHHSVVPSHHGLHRPLPSMQCHMLYYPPAARSGSRVCAMFHIYILIPFNPPIVVIVREPSMIRSFITSPPSLKRRLQPDHTRAEPYSPSL